MNRRGFLGRILGAAATAIAAPALTTGALPLEETNGYVKRIFPLPSQEIQCSGWMRYEDMQKFYAENK